MIKRAVLISAVVLAVFANALAGDSGVKVISRPAPGGSANCSQPSGLIRMRVVFHEYGKVTGVEVEQPSGCDSWDREAIRAAWKIKFKPAVKDGKKITVTKQVEYTFTAL